MLDIEKVRSLREKLELTQEQAAKRAGLKTRQRWSGIESGRMASISLQTLGKIADALDVEPAELLVKGTKKKAPKK